MAQVRLLLLLRRQLRPQHALLLLQDRCLRLPLLFLLLRRQLRILQRLLLPLLPLILLGRLCRLGRKLLRRCLRLPMSRGCRRSAAI